MNTFSSSIGGRIADYAMYARVNRHGRIRESMPATRRNSLLFVDLDTQDRDDVLAALGHIRFLAPVGLGHVSMVLVRWPLLEDPDGELAEGVFGQLSWVLDRLRIQCSAGLVVARPGHNPMILWGKGSLAPSESASIDEDQLLALSRSIELSALLINGRGLWSPEAYHYRLPSGRHSGTFVRIADAIRTTRDAEVLAWWLLRYASSGLTIVSDSSTLVPIMLAFGVELQARGMGRADTTILASYPATSFDFARTIRRAARGPGPVLGLLSVSSSGSIRDHFERALQDCLGSDRWALDTLVDKALDEPLYIPDGLGERSGTSCVWLGLGQTGETAAESCQLCADPERARVVHIDPTSFDGLVLPDPQLLTPDIRFADRARQFWEICDAADAIALDAQAHPTAAHVRPQNSTMGVRVDFDPILTAAKASDSREPVNGRLVQLLIERFPRVESVDLVLALRSELDRADGGGWMLAEKVFKTVAPSAIVQALELTGRQDERVIDAITHSRHLAFFSLGVVTGTSLHRMLAEVSDLRRQSDAPAPDLEVFVVHARASSYRALETIVNPFGTDRVHIAVESLLPDATAPSPLRDEAQLLRTMTGSGELERDEFLSARLELLRGAGTGQMLVFWGLEDPASPARRLRPGSLYGESLSSLAAFIAVGSAVHRRREGGTRGGTPEWRQFEIPAITKSYFDPLIVCSVLRWLRPEECWWGRELKDSRAVMEEFLGGYERPDELRVLLAEFLLASSQGKVPRPAVEVLVDRANAFADANAQGRGPIRLGLDLVSQVLGRSK